MSDPVTIYAWHEPVSREKGVPPALRALAQRFGIEHPCERINFRVGECEFGVVCDWSKGKHGISVQGFHLTRKTKRRPAIVLRRESARDQDGKSLGLNREVQTGDPTFDGHVYVESAASEAAVLETLSAQGVRSGAVALLAGQATKVEIGPDAVTAHFSRPISGEGELEPDVILSLIGPFADLLQALPRPTLEIPKETPESGCLGLLLIIGAPILAVIGYILSWSLRDTTGIVGYKPFILGAGAGLVLSVVGTALAYVSVRIWPSSTGYRAFIARTVLSFFVCLPGGTPLLLLVDGVTAHASPRRDVATEILDYTVSSGEWELEVRSWNRQGDSEVFVVDSYPGVSTGGQLLLSIQTGALGFQWVDRYSAVR